MLFVRRPPPFLFIAFPRRKRTGLPFNTGGGRRRAYAVNSHLRRLWWSRRRLKRRMPLRRRSVVKPVGCRHRINSVQWAFACDLCVRSTRINTPGASNSFPQHLAPFLPSGHVPDFQGGESWFVWGLVNESTAFLMVLL